MLSPKLSPVTPVVGEVKLLIDPVPSNTDHKPVPTVGVFAAIVVVAVEIQIVCAGPALDILGLAST